MISLHHRSPDSKSAEFQALSLLPDENVKTPLEAPTGGESSGEAPEAVNEETIKDLFSAAVHQTLTAEEATMLLELIAQQPERAIHLHAETHCHQALKTLVQQRVYPVQPEAYWRNLTEHIMKRAEHNATQSDDGGRGASVLHQSISQQVLSQIPSRILSQMSSRSASRTWNFWALQPLPWLRSAAVLIVGVGIGFMLGLWGGKSSDFSFFTGNNRSAEDRVARQVSSYQGGYQAGAAVVDAPAMREFLQQAQVLLVGVMNMNAECGVGNPQTLAAQRSACVNLLLRSQTLRQSAFIHQAPQMEQLLTNIEHALAEIAAVEPTTLNARRIRHIQAHSDYALCELAQHSGVRYLLDNP